MDSKKVLNLETLKAEANNFLENAKYKITAKQINKKWENIEEKAEEYNGARLGLHLLASRFNLSIVDFNFEISKFEKEDKEEALKILNRINEIKLHSDFYNKDVPPKIREEIANKLGMNEKEEKIFINYSDLTKEQYKDFCKNYLAKTEEQKENIDG